MYFLLGAFILFLFAWQSGNVFLTWLALLGVIIAYMHKNYEKSMTKLNSRNTNNIQLTKPVTNNSNLAPPNPPAGFQANGQMIPAKDPSLNAPQPVEPAYVKELSNSVFDGQSATTNVPTYSYQVTDLNTVRTDLPSYTPKTNNAQNTFAYDPKAPSIPNDTSDMPLPEQLNDPAFDRANCSTKWRNDFKNCPTKFTDGPKCEVAPRDPRLYVADLNPLMYKRKKLAGAKWNPYRHMQARQAMQQLLALEWNPTNDPYTKPVESPDETYCAKQAKFGHPQYTTF